MGEAVGVSDAIFPIEPERRSQSRAASAGIHSVRTLDGVPARRFLLNTSSTISSALVIFFWRPFFLMSTRSLKVLSKRVAVFPL
jgi:hypothetical protein